jgi:hypothetical protein
MIKEFWTIEEKDVGGMLGGYPRLLGYDGWYSETETSKAKQFTSIEDIMQSVEWQKVKDNTEYRIVHFQKRYRKLSEDERMQHLNAIEKCFDELENGHSWWNRIRE